MAVNWADFAASEDKSKAVANVAGAQGVDPQAAATALRNAPVSGIPASVAMHAPPEGFNGPDFANQSGALNTSPEVASFAAKDPAIAAATKDDFTSLAGVASTLNRWKNQAVSDLLAPGQAAARQSVVDLQRAYNAPEPHNLLEALVPGMSPKDRAVGSFLADAFGVATSGFSGAANVVARPLSYIPAYKTNGFGQAVLGPNGLPVRATQQEAQSQIANSLLLSTMALGPRAGRAGVPPIIDEGTFGANHPLLPGPVEHIPDAEFTDLTPPGVNPAHSEVYSSVAELDAEHATRVQQAISETKTQSRAPELTQQFLEDHTTAKGETVSVPPEAIQKLWGDGHAVFPDQAEAVQRGLITGNEVQIPLSDYLTQTAGQPFAEELNAATRFRPDGVSLNQAKDLPKVEGFDTAENASAFIAKPNTIDTNLIEGMLPLAEKFGGKFAIGRANTAFQFPTVEDRLAFMEAAGKEKLAPNFEQTEGPPVERRARPRTAEDEAAFQAAIQTKDETLQTRGNFELTSADTPNGTAYVVKPNTTDMAEVEALLPKVQEFGGRYAMGRANTAFQFRTPEAREAFLKSMDVPRTEAAIPEDVEPELHQPIRELAAKVDDVVEQVFKENALDTLFTEPKAAGLTKGLFDRYSNAVEEARAEIHDKLMQRTYNQIRKERTPDFKAAVALHKEEAVKQIEAQPNVQAMRALADSELKIDRDAIPEGLRLPNNIQKRGGLSPDEAAELAGYPTGKELLLDLHNLQIAIEANGGTLHKYIQARAQVYGEEQARQMTGYDISPNALLEAAREAVASPKIEDLLINALQEVGKRLGLPLDKEAVQSVADANFAAMNIKDAAKPKSFSTDMKRLGDRAERAILAGKEIEAFKFKQQQLLQFHQLKASYAFQKELARGTRVLNQIAKKPIVAGMDQTARNHLRWIAREVGFKVSTNKYEGVDEALQGVTLDQYVDSLRAQGFEPVLANIPRPPSQGDFTDMSVDDFRGLMETVKSIGQLGRDAKKVYNQRKAAELAEINAEIKQNATALVGRVFTAGELRKLKGTMKGMALTAGRNLGASITRPETFLYWLDGETNGPLMKYVVGELQDGKYFKTDMIQQIGDGLREFTKAQPKGWEHSLEDSVDVPELLYSVDRHGDPIPWLQNKGQVIMMATHFGTESNFKKLAEGFGWDPDTVREVANRELTEADWKYVQHILDINKMLLPKVQELYRAVKGLAMKTEPAVPIETPFGTFAGGYRHVDYDWNAVEERMDEEGEPVAQEDPTALKGASLFGGNYRSALPPSGYTLARTQFSAPINLEHSILHREIESVVHDLAYRKQLIQATKIFRQQGVRQAVREALGPEYMDTINHWLQDIARQANYDQTSLKGMAAILRGVRRRFTMVQIGMNVATLIKHGGIAMGHIDGEVGIANFAKASADLFRDPDLQKFVDDNSGEVRGSLMNLDRDVREIMQDTFRKQGFIDLWRYHAFTMFGAVKRVEAMATWLTKYRMLTDDQGLSHEDAVALANKAVRDTQGAGAVVDLPALWRGDGSLGNEALKLTNMFTGFENTTSNRAWTMVRRSTRPGGGKGGGPPQLPLGYEDRGDAGARRDFQKTLSDLMAYFVYAALMATAADTLLKGRKGSDFLQTFGENFLKGLLGGSIPMGSTFADVPRGIKSNWKDFGSDNPVVQMGKAIGVTAANTIDLATGHPEKVEDRWVQHAIETVGYTMNVPVKPLSNAGQFAWDKTQGHVPNDSLLEAMRGVLFGPSSDEAKKPPTRRRGSRGRRR